MTSTRLQKRSCVFFSAGPDPERQCIGLSASGIMTKEHSDCSLRGERAMKIKRRGSASWKGGLKDGRGSITTESGALQAYPYGFASRFEGQRGTNPEELIGAAHAGCFTMALSLILGQAQLVAEQMDT